MSLGDCAVALDAGEGEAALRALITCWRARPSVELERAVFALSAWLDTGLERLPVLDA